MKNVQTVYLGIIFVEKDKRLGSCQCNGIKEDDISKLVAKGINKQMELLVDAQNFENKDFIALSSRIIVDIDKMIHRSYIKVDAYKELITKLYLDFKKELIDENQCFIIKERLKKDKDFHFKNCENLETEKNRYIIVRCKRISKTCTKI